MAFKLIWNIPGRYSIKKPIRYSMSYWFHGHGVQIFLDFSISLFLNYICINFKHSGAVYTLIILCFSQTDSH